MMCADCDGRCSVAAGTRPNSATSPASSPITSTMATAPTPASNTRELTPEARDWAGADLEAARQACPNRLDFARLLPEAERHLT